MGNIDTVLQNAVNQVNKQPEVEAQSIDKVEKKKKPAIEDVPAVEEQMDLIETEVKPESKKKFKVKSYGKEKEIEVKDEELPEYIQKGHSATEKWKEAQDFLRQAQEIQKKNEEFAQNFKKDPESAMELLLGRDTLDSLSEKRILRAMEMEKMSPEQKEEYEVKQRLAKYKKEEEEYKTRQQQAEESKQVAFFEAQFKDMTSKSLQKIGFEKPSKMIINRFLMTIRPFLANAEGPASQEDMDILASHFQSEMEKERAEHISSMDGSQIAKWLGQEGVEKLRKHLMNGYSKPPVKPEAPKPTVKPGNLRDYIKSL